MASDNPAEVSQDIVDRKLADFIQRVKIISVSGNQVFVQRDGAAAADTMSYATNDDVTFVANDYALMVKVGSGYVVVCRIVHN